MVWKFILVVAIDLRTITLRLKRTYAGYVHVNPLKHGLVKCVSDWPYSTFHRYVDNGIYDLDWCGDVEVQVGGDD